MPKSCDRCNESFTGFGSTCSSCRKSGSKEGVVRTCIACQSHFNGFGNLCNDCQVKAGNKCAGCGGTVYANERLGVEGLTFHPACFKCTQCGNKLGMGNFSKTKDGQFYCKVHYAQLFRLRGRYSFSEKDKETAVGMTPSTAAADEAPPPKEEPANAEAAPAAAEAAPAVAEETPAPAAEAEAAPKAAEEAPAAAEAAAEGGEAAAADGGEAAAAVAPEAQ